MISRYSKYVPWLIVAILVAIIVLRPEPASDQLLIDSLHEEIKDLNENISRLEDENSRITTDLALKMDSISVLESDVQYIKDKRTAAIRYYEKKIRDVDKLTTSELDSFFIARYQGRRDTTEVDSN